MLPFTFILYISVGIPSCAEVMSLQSGTGKFCSANLTWQQPPNTPPVTSTTVTYCRSIPSPNCVNMTCSSPCTIGGLLNGTRYEVTVMPNNNCGKNVGCPANATTTPSKLYFCIMIVNRFGRG